ncbi:MAG: TonB-dependent siderophore receptor, partial [Opitutaceae bacterium]
MRLPFPVYYSCLFSVLVAGTAGAQIQPTSVAAPAAPRDQRDARAFRIPAADASEALDAFSRQAGSALVYVIEHVRDIRTNGIDGLFRPRDALERLVANTPLRVVEDTRTGALMIKRVAPPKPTPQSGAPSQSEPPKYTSIAKPMKKPLPARLAAAFAALTTATLSAQKESETIVLSPFEVSAGASDEGYITNNALGGTKIDTPLRYTPMNIQVINARLLDDIGATNSFEALAYQAGVERQPLVGENQTGVNIRGYGIFYQVREGFRRFDLSDAANMDRVEVIAGPAAVFYGFSQPGGLINTFNKAPVENRNFGSISLMYGTWNQFRATLDGNASLGHGLTIRTTASYTFQDKDWREWGHLRRRMISPVIKWRISPSTTLKLDYEYLLNTPQFTHDKIQDADLNPTTGAATLANRFVPMPRGRQWTGPDQRYNIYVENLILTLDHRFSDWLSMNAAGNYYGRGTPTGLENNQMRGGPVIAALRDRDQNLVRDANGNPIKAIRTVWSERDIRNTVRNGRVDFLAKFNALGIKNKVLAGWSYTFDMQNKYEIFDRPANATGTNFGAINGQGFNYRYYALNDPNPDLTMFGNPNWNAPTFIHPNTNHRETQKYTAGYVSHAGEMFNGKIHTLVGVRRDEFNFERRPYSRVLWSGEGVAVNQSQTKVNPMLGIVYTPVSALSFYGLHSTSLEAPPVQTNSIGQILANRQGSSLEGGVKFSFLGGRLAGTSSVFKIRNKNIAVFDPNIPN